MTQVFSGLPGTRQDHHAPPRNRAFTIIRESGEDQLRGYGPETQWHDDVLPIAASLGVQVCEEHRRIIQEPATGWDRPKFEAAVNEAISLHQSGEVDALIFPRVDRETRFLYPSFPILVEALKSGLKVFFARERLQLDSTDDESLSRYLRKAEESRAYVETMRVNTTQGRRRRTDRDHMMPTAHDRWAYEYHRYRRNWGKPADAHSGRFTLIPERGPIVQAWARWILEEGLSLSQCHRRTKSEFGVELCRSTVGNTLKDPIVIGKLYSYRTKKVRGPKGTKEVRLPESQWVLVYEDPSLAIITEEQFHALKPKWQRNQEKGPRHIKNWYPPIRGMIFCASCGKKMSGQTRSNNEETGFRCPPCRRWVKAVPLWTEIQSKVREIVLQPDLLAAALKSRLDNGDTVARLEGEIKTVRSKMTLLARAEQKALRLHLYIDSEGREAFSEETLLAEEVRIRGQREELQRRETAMLEQMDQLRQARVDEVGIRRFLETASRNLDAWDEARWAVLLEALRVKVVACDDEIQVTINVPTSVDDRGVIVDAIWSSRTMRT